MASKIGRASHRIEDALAFLAIGLMALVLAAEVVIRLVFRTGIPDSTAYVQHLVLIGTFIAAAVTSRENRHLSLASGWKIGEPLKSIVGAASAALSAALLFAFAAGSVSFGWTAFSPAERVGFLPKRLVVMIMAAGFLAMGVRALTALEKKRGRHWAAGAAVLAAGVVGFEPLANAVAAIVPSWSGWLQAAQGAVRPVVEAVATPAVVLLVVLGFLGVPIFLVLGGAGYFLFVHGGLPPEIIPNQAYTVLTGHAIPAIPLFAAVGFFLSESRAGERMVRFFKAVFSWFPGGLTIMAVLVCAFFTTFTGASGVTILALGGLLSYILVEAGYPKTFAVGLLTASGSIGLLFPPSLPVIIYGVTAQTSIKDMFLGGLLPGLLLVLSVAAIGIVVSVRAKIPRHPLRVGEALAAFGESFWELLLPIVVFGLYFGGITNLQESAAAALVYIWIVETFIKRDLKMRDLARVVAKCVPIVGGVLIILALANGLSYYIIDAQIPTKLSALVETAVSSKIVFLLALNVALLVVGCFMDIYSAILVIVPLIIPLGGLFGIHPVHLGIIFLANLELGYMTPPVGMNLFLASYRFNVPMPRIYRSVGLFLAVRLAAVLLITYVPLLVLALL